MFDRNSLRPFGSTCTAFKAISEFKTGYQSSPRPSETVCLGAVDSAALLTRLSTSKNTEIKYQCKCQQRTTISQIFIKEHLKLKGSYRKLFSKIGFAWEKSIPDQWILFNFSIRLSSKMPNHITFSSI